MSPSTVRGGKTLLVINPHSARGQAEFGAALDVLRASDQEVFVHEANTPDALPALIATHATGMDRVVVGGGDGTLNGVIEAVLASGLPLGILPTGTANDLARGLGIPVDPVEACRIIARGHTRPIDLGCVNGKHFFNVASLGASVEIARSMQQRRDRNARWGVLSYPLAMLTAIRRCRPFRAHMQVDGHAQDVWSYQIAVGNGRFYGGGMTVAEDAKLDDGSLDLYSLKVRSFWQILLHFPAFRAGRHAAWRGVVHLRGRVITVRTSRSMPVNTDGELTTRTPAVFTVLPGALPVFVPADGGEALRQSPAQEAATMPVLRSDAEVALDDVVVGCKSTAEHLAEAAELTQGDAPALSALFQAQSDERADMAATLERRMIEMGVFPGDPDDDLEVVGEAIRRVRDVLSNDHRRMLVEDSLGETEDLATAVSRALQEDLPPEMHETLSSIQHRIAAAINLLRTARADLAAAKRGRQDGNDAVS
ncbi:MAG: lipid kinase [Rhodospirillaceae bacterium]